MSGLENKAPSAVSSAATLGITGAVSKLSEPPSPPIPPALGDTVTFGFPPGVSVKSSPEEPGLCSDKEISYLINAKDKITLSTTDRLHTPSLGLHSTILAISTQRSLLATRRCVVVVR